MKLQTERYYLNPANVCKDWLKIDLPTFITVNPNLTTKTGAQFQINRQIAHDGTLTFTRDLFAQVLIGLLKKETVYAEYGKQLFVRPESYFDNLDWFRNNIRYEVGLISVAAIFGNIDGKPGQRERARLPVKCILSKVN